MTTRCQNSRLFCKTGCTSLHQLLDRNLQGVLQAPAGAEEGEGRAGRHLDMTTCRLHCEGGTWRAICSCSSGGRCSRGGVGGRTMASWGRASVCLAAPVQALRAACVGRRLAGNSQNYNGAI